MKSVTGIQGVKTRNDIQHTTENREGPHHEEFSGSKVTGATVKQLIFTNMTKVNTPLLSVVLS